jgi:hypothetical protein
MPSDDPLSNLVSDSPSDDAVRHDLSDAEFDSPSPSPTLTQPVAPSPSQPDADSMSGDSPTQARSASGAIPDSRDTLLSEPSQSEQIVSMLEEDHTSSSISALVDSTSSLSSISEYSSHGVGSNEAYEGPSETSFAHYMSETCPHLIPLPESDVEGESPSEFTRVERARTTLGYGNQDRGAYMNPMDERTSESSHSDVQNIASPSTRFHYLESSFECNTCRPR